MNILYIATNFLSSSHNYSIAIIYNDRVYAIELERMNRIKDYPQLPGKPNGLDPLDFQNIDTTRGGKIDHIQEYLTEVLNGTISQFGIDIQEVDKIYSLNIPKGIVIKNFQKEHIALQENNHHTFHAYSAYFPSPYTKAVVLCIDHDGYDESLWGLDIMHSIWDADEMQMHCIYKDVYTPNTLSAWIGALYENSAKICDIWEGTFMGLSAYGKNKWKNNPLFQYSHEHVSMRTDIFPWKSYSSYWDFQMGTLQGLEKFFHIQAPIHNTPIEKSPLADVAKKVQEDTEEAILFLARKAYMLTWKKNICLAGWVALNILANTRILRELAFENIFVQPACTDSGLSLGAVYYLYHQVVKNQKKIPLLWPWLGFTYSDEEYLQALWKYKDQITYSHVGQEKYPLVARALLESKIVGWFQWGSEFWPRSLWFRSILASSIPPDMKKKVNRIKMREFYRPLAPILLEEDIWIYLDTFSPSPYMTLSANVRENIRERIPSVVHVDGTCRYQSVNEIQNPEIYKLLQNFKKLTGESVLINTSFNQHNEPIVEKPEDALDMFLATDMDILCLGGYIVYKHQKNTELAYLWERVVSNYLREVHKNEHILIEVILSNQCNKRCDYCDLDFRNQSISISDLDALIDFCKENPALYTINFFGGEPLLEFEKLVYFVEKSAPYIQKYSIGTNGILLDEEKLTFLKNHDITIHLSVDNITQGKGIQWNLITSYSQNIKINFINDPDYIQRSIETFDILRSHELQNIAFMPVFCTKKWSQSALASFNKVVQYVHSFDDRFHIQYFSYFNWVAVDKQFIFDTDGFFYSDIDSLLWLQKQYSHIDPDLKEQIHISTKIGSCRDQKFTLDNLIKWYNLREILKLIFEIPRKNGDILSYTLIDKILKNGAKKK